LNNLYHKLPSEDTKNELIRAYQRRKLWIQEVGIESTLPDNKADTIEFSKAVEFNEKFFDISIDDEFVVGMWYMMSKDFIEKYFHKGFCGSYTEDHKYFSKNEWGLMYTPEASMLIYQFKQIEKGLNESSNCWHLFEHLDTEKDIN